MIRAALCLALLGCGRFGFEGHAAGDAGLDAPDPGVVELSVRGDHVCVRTGEGLVYCWGSNSHGQLGRGSAGGMGEQGLANVSNIARIWTGEGSSFALDRSGQLWAWGKNDNGELGLGTLSSDEPVPKLVPVPGTVVELAAGEYQTCARVTNGDVYCWGGDNCGAIGDGMMTPLPTPTRVPGLGPMDKVAVHDALSCAVDAAGAVKCWGAIDNIAGTCTAQHFAPTTPVGLPPIAELSGGCHMSICAADRSGGAWCWGENNAGNLGDGSGMLQVEPVRVAALTGVSGIGTGYQVSCARTNNDELSCWGDNTTGELGIGTSGVTDSPLPARLPFFTGMPIDDIEVGCANACARSKNDIYCWGSNNAGQVGDHTVVDRYAPQHVTVVP